MKNWPYLLVAASLFFLVSCSEEQRADHYSHLFNCHEYIVEYEKRYPSLVNNAEYRESRVKECNVARGILAKDYKNVSNARYYMGEFYRGIGETWIAAEMYKSSIAALLVKDSWKSWAYCSSAALSSGRLISSPHVQQNEKAIYARLAARWGNQEGTYNYAVFLEKGEGVLRDVVSAYAWYNITAAHAEGSRAKEAKEALERLDSILPMQVRIQAQALSKELLQKRDANKECKYLVGE